MSNYQKLERPVANETEPVILKFGLTLQQIMDVDEKNQILTTNVWLNLVSVLLFFWTFYILIDRLYNGSEHLPQIAC